MTHRYNGEQYKKYLHNQSYQCITYGIFARQSVRPIIDYVWKKWSVFKNVFKSLQNMCANARSKPLRL